MSRKTVLIRIFRIVILILIYLGVWQLLSMIVGSSLLLPSPVETAERFFRIIVDKDCLLDLGFTFLRLIAGYLLGAAAGIVLAVLTARSSFFRFLLSPFRVLIKSTPVLSFVLLLLVSVVSNMVPVVVAAIMVAPMIWATTEQAILSLDTKLTEMACLYFTPFQQFHLVYLPQMLPQILASGLTALGFAWKAVITAEVLSLPKFAIGNRMYLSKIYLETPDMVAWTVLVVSLSLALELLLKYTTKRLRRRYDSD